MRKLIFFQLLLLMGVRAAAQPENLVFEGAGIRGIAYSGALAELDAHGLLKKIQRVGGTSAGAITALLVSLGYTPDEISHVIQHTRFQKFNSGRFFFIGGLHRLKNNFGWYRSHQFERWLDGLIKAKTGNGSITFSELTANGYKALYVTGTDLTAQRAVVFSAETFPAMRVRDAVKISISIPLYFEATFIKADGTLVPHPKAKAGLHVLVDGGMVANFPISLFDSARYANATRENGFAANPHTIGFRIDSEAQRRADSSRAGLAAIPITRLRHYLTAFYTLMLETGNRQRLTAEDWQRTVSIADGGTGPRIKRLRQKEIMTLIENGRRATAAFLAARPY